jgi:hypothetical protein
VTLTGTMPKVDRFGNTWMMRHIGPQIIQTVGPGQRVPPGFNAWEHHTPGALRALLEDLDPGITFTLPPANAYEFRNITVPRYSVGAAPTA